MLEQVAGRTKQNGVSLWLLFVIRHSDWLNLNLVAQWLR
jgi:hypothetical protein